jgi:hypothetical protein
MQEQRLDDALRGRRHSIQEPMSLHSVRQHREVTSFQNNGTAARFGDWTRRKYGARRFPSAGQYCPHHNRFQCGRRPTRTIPRHRRSLVMRLPRVCNAVEIVPSPEGETRPTANKANALVSKARCLALLLDEPRDRIHQIKFGENFELLVRHFHKYCGAVVAENVGDPLDRRV